MLKPYQKIEEVDDFIVYEFKTFYLYLMYGIFGTLAMGYFQGSSILSISGIILMVAYFLLVSTQYLEVNKKIKQASEASSVEVSGSKWSFSNPLRVKIKKEFI